MRPLFAIIGLSGTVMMLTGIIGLSHKSSQDWGYRQLMIGLFATSFSGAAVVVDDLTNRSHP
jgi:membrane-bound ClpP family serine protease